MRRRRCYNCGEPVEQAGNCGVCAMSKRDGDSIDAAYARLEAALDDEGFYPGCRDDLRTVRYGNPKGSPV